MSINPEPRVLDDLGLYVKPLRLTSLLRQMIAAINALLAGGGGGGGTVTTTSVTPGSGIAASVATATTTPNISIALAAIADQRVLANISGGSAAPIPNTLSAILDAILGATQGQLITRNASNWTVLNPGIATWVLTSGGAGANLSWTAPAGGSGPSINNVTGAYQFVAADYTGLVTVRHPPSDNTPRIWTIPATATVTNVIGLNIPLRVGAASGAVSLTPAVGVTLLAGGNSSSGTRTLAPGFVGNLQCEDVNVWNLSGTGWS